MVLALAHSPIDLSEENRVWTIRKKERKDSEQEEQLLDQSQRHHMHLRMTEEEEEIVTRGEGLSFACMENEGLRATKGAYLSEEEPLGIERRGC